MPWSSSDRRSRLPTDWPARRAAVLERDQETCQRCGAWANQVDHIRAGDDHRLENLQALCDPCHRAKSSAEGVAAQPRRKRPPRPHPGML